MMTALLLNSGAAPRIVEKAAQMAVADPHGVTITLVSVSLVFCVLFILFVAYNISGAIFTRKQGQKEAAKSDTVTDGSGEFCEEVAAICIALDKFLSEAEGDDGGIHDVESGIITIKRQRYL